MPLADGPIAPFDDAAGVWLRCAFHVHTTESDGWLIPEIQRRYHAWAGYDVLSITTKVWDAMTPAQQAKFQAAADKAMDENTARYNAQEKETVEFYKSSGKKVYAPDLNAFRTFAQKRYVDKYGSEWPKGALERINAL